MRAGGDVEKDHFVRALLVIAQRQFDRVAHVAQFARFGPAEPDAARDLAVMNIQARNDAFGEHGASPKIPDELRGIIGDIIPGSSGNGWRSLRPEAAV